MAVQDPQAPCRHHQQRGSGKQDLHQLDGEPTRLALEAGTIASISQGAAKTPANVTNDPIRKRMAKIASASCEASSCRSSARGGHTRG